MKLGRLFGTTILISGLFFAGASQATLIGGQLFNTGLDDSGNPLGARGGVDAHWLVDGNNAITYKHPAYAANGDDSSWISLDAHGGSHVTRSTSYLYTTTFDLSGYDSNSASISGLWGADNYGSIFLNGYDTGNELTFGYGAFRSLTAFTIEDFFVDGINTLSVQLTNGHINPAHRPGPGALRFDNLELRATAIPEPGSMALLAVGVLGLYISRKKQSGKQAD